LLQDAINAADLVDVYVYAQAQKEAEVAALAQKITGHLQKTHVHQREHSHSTSNNDMPPTNSHSTSFSAASTKQMLSCIGESGLGCCLESCYQQLQEG
jgi:hypothetical protein